MIIYSDYIITLKFIYVIVKFSFKRLFYNKRIRKLKLNLRFLLILDKILLNKRIVYKN